MEKNVASTGVYCGYLGIMEETAETTLEYCGYLGTMAENMETTNNVGLSCM